jgi:hypothetical protein
MMVDAVPEAPCIIAKCRDYGELIEAMRAWFVRDLNVTYSCVDGLAGLPDGHAGKLFAPIPHARAGPRTLSALLAAGGLQLLLAVDTERIARVRNDANFRERSPRAPYSKRHANAAVRTRKARRGRPFDSATGRIMRARGILATTPGQRRKWARAAALARWGKPMASNIL